MNQSDLDYFAGLDGVTTCGLRSPNGATLVRHVTDAYWGAQVEQMIGKVAQGCQTARKNGLAGDCFCWQFERAWFFCGLREDGTALVLVSHNNPENAEQLREAARAFARSA